MPTGTVPPEGLACNLAAIGEQDRGRYRELVRRLRSAVQSSVEIPEGYVLHVAEDVIEPREIAEWMQMEKQCCPFLSISLSTPDTDKVWRLQLTGPTGVKAILETELGAGPTGQLRRRAAADHI